jgi:hypothetical protein
MMPKRYPARLENQGIKGISEELAREPGFSHDFNGLVKSPLFSLSFPAVSDRGCHLCALALGISQPAGLAEIISAFGPHGCDDAAIRRAAGMRLYFWHPAHSKTL